MIGYESLIHMVASGDVNGLRYKLSKERDRFDDYDIFRITNYARELKQWNCLRIITEMEPESMCKLGRSGYSPVHMATIDSCKECIEILAETVPEAFSVKASNGYTPVHLLFYERAPDIESIKLLIEKMPESFLAVTGDNLKNTTAHLAARGCSLECLKLVSAISPSLLEAVDNQGRTAMHVAALKGAVGCMEYIYETFPLSVYTLDKDRKSPIFMLCVWIQQQIPEIIDPLYRDRLDTLKGTVEFVKRIVEQNPQILDIRTSYSGDTLAHAVTGCCTLNALFLRYAPYMFKIRNKKGNTPLHNCMKKTTLWTIVKNIFKHVPDAFSIPNNNGRLPVHIAIGSGCTRIVRFIAKTLPSTLSLRTCSSNTPIHLAALLSRRRCFKAIAEADPWSLWIESAKEKSVWDCLDNTTRCWALPIFLFAETCLATMTSSALLPQGSSSSADGRKEEKEKEENDCPLANIVLKVVGMQSNFLYRRMLDL